MKKNFLMLLCTVILTSMTATVWASNEESDSTEPSEPSTKCQWEQDSCGLFQGSREICVESGNGEVCSCGDVTRKC